MFYIQNLTKKEIRFQNITIGPYVTIPINSISDYVSLSTLSNAGKIRYFSKPSVVKTTKQKDSDVITPIKEEVDVEKETKLEDVVETKVEVSVEKASKETEEVTDTKIIKDLEENKDSTRTYTTRKKR